MASSEFPYPFPCNKVLFDLKGPYVRILHAARTLTSHECLGIGRDSPQGSTIIALQHYYQVLR